MGEDILNKPTAGIDLDGLLADENLSARAKLLVVHLSRYRGPVERSQADLNLIAQGNTSGYTLRKALREAERAGWLHIDRTHIPHTYRVTVPKDRQEETHGQDQQP